MYTLLDIWFYLTVLGNFGSNFRQQAIIFSARKILKIKRPQSAITCSKLTIETLEQGVKYVQSKQ